jgi:hypothetical protein
MITTYDKPLFILINKWKIENRETHEEEQEFGD